jgi:hypothetical protein
MPAAACARAYRVHLDDELEQVADETGIVHEVHHERVDAAQVGRPAQVLNPPHRDLSPPARAFINSKPRSPCACGHAQRSEIWGPQPRLVREQRVAFDEGGRLVRIEFDVSPAVRRLARRVRHARDAIEVVVFGGTDLGLGEHAVIPHVVAVLRADVIRAELHHDRQRRKRSTGWPARSSTRSHWVMTAAAAYRPGRRAATGPRGGRKARPDAHVWPCSEDHRRSRSRGRSLGVLWPLVGRAVRHALGIEDGDVGLHAGRHPRSTRPIRCAGNEDILVWRLEARSFFSRT